MLFAGIVCILETYYFLEINNGSEKTKKNGSKSAHYFLRRFKILINRYIF